MVAGEYVRFPGGASGKEPACPCRRRGLDPWVRKIPWRRKWQPTPIFSPEKSHGQRSQVGYTPWGHKESDTTEQLTVSVFQRMFSNQNGIRLEMDNRKLTEKFQKT